MSKVLKADKTLQIQEWSTSNNIIELEQTREIKIQEQLQKISKIVGRPVKNIIRKKEKSSFGKFIFKVGFPVTLPILVYIKIRDFYFKLRYPQVKKYYRKIDQLDRYFNSEHQELDYSLENIKKGLTGENAVHKEITYLSNKFILLNDVTIPTPRSTTQIDHVLISPTKITCIETKHIHGKFYNTKDNQKWIWYPTNNNKHMRGQLTNSPQMQSIYHKEQLEKLLKSRHLDLDVEAIVVLTHPETVWCGTNNCGCEVMYIDEMNKYLKKHNRKKILDSADREAIASFLIKLNNQHSNTHYAKFQ